MPLSLEVFCFVLFCIVFVCFLVRVFHHSNGGELRQRQTEMPGSHDQSEGLSVLACIPTWQQMAKAKRLFTPSGGLGHLVQPPTPQIPKV